MKNYLLAFVAMMGLCGISRAQVATDARPDFIVAPHSLSCSSTTLSASTPVELTGNTTSPANVPVYEILVMTLSASATSYFSENASVATSGNLIGVPVYPFVTNGQPPFIPFLVGRTQKFYGISGTAGQSVMICKKK